MRAAAGALQVAEIAVTEPTQRENTGSRGARPRQQSFPEHSLSDALEGRVGCDRAPDVSRRQVTEVLPEVMFRGEISGAAICGPFFVR
jgi:hypothetical protein